MAVCVGLEGRCASRRVAMPVSVLAMREPEEEKVPIGLPLPDLTMDQFIDIEDCWSMREDRV